MVVHYLLVKKGRGPTEFGWRFYVLSASKAIFRVRTCSHNITYSVW